MKRIYTSNYNFNMYPEKYMSFFRSYMQYFPVDRFGVLKPVDGFDVYYDPWPEFNGNSFRELCFERLRDFVDKDKSLLLFASGGIDSLTVICLFVIAGLADRIKVVHFENEEINSDIITILQNLGVEYQVCGEKVSFNFDNYYLIDGMYGDIFEKPVYPNVFTIEVSDFEKRFKDFLVDEDIISWADKSPVVLKKIEDFIWYFGYCLKYRSYNQFSLRNLVYVLTGQILDFNNHESFYCIKPFSDYAYTHYDDIVHGDSFVYKQIFKDIIFEVFSDSRKRDLINGIGKTNSIVGTWKGDIYQIRKKYMMNPGIRDKRYYSLLYYDGITFSAKYVGTGLK